MTSVEINYSHKDDWDNAVELAYVLNDVVELNKKWKRYNLTEVAKQTMDYDFFVKAGKVASSLDRIGWGHARYTSFGRGWARDRRPTEPYSTLMELSNSFAFAVIEDKNPKLQRVGDLGKNGSRSLEELEVKLFEITGNLVGREVEIIDPYIGVIGQMSISGVV